MNRTESGGNVFRDLGLDDADKLLIASLRQQLAQVQNELNEAKKDNEFLKEAIDLAVKDRDHYLEESQSRLEGLTGCMESKRVLIDRITSLEGAATRKDAGSQAGAGETIGSLTTLTQQLAEAKKDAERLGKLLREASGPMSYGHWSSDFRNKVMEALK